MVKNEGIPEVPKSTISQRIAALEMTVGTGLIRRTSRSFSLTEAGAQLLPHARAIDDVARQVEHSLLEQGSELQGTLRISCSNALSQFALSPLVPRFLAKHERVSVRVETSNRLVDLVSEGFDMTLRGHVGPLKDSTLRQRVVARTKWAQAASPDWIAAHGQPATPADVRAGQVLCFSTTNECPVWALRRSDEEVVVKVAPRLVSDDMITLRTSAIAGGGITCLPAYMLRDAVLAGDLVPVLPDWAPHTSIISVLTPPRAQSSRLASAFSEFLAAELPRVMQVW